jgi:hypothetical protein
LVKKARKAAKKAAKKAYKKVHGATGEYRGLTPLGPPPRKKGKA